MGQQALSITPHELALALAEAYRLGRLSGQPTYIDIDTKEMAEELAPIAWRCGGLSVEGELKLAGMPVEWCAETWPDNRPPWAKIYDGAP